MNAPLAGAGAAKDRKKAFSSFCSLSSRRWHYGFESVASFVAGLLSGQKLQRVEEFLGRSDARRPQRIDIDRGGDNWVAEISGRQDRPARSEDPDI
jgi:hypothetical protein